MDWKEIFVQMIEFTISILNLLQNATLLACPLVIYIFIFKGRNRIKIQEGHYSIPDWNHFLKKWWVRWQLWKLKRHDSAIPTSSVAAFMASQEDEKMELPRVILNGKKVDSMTICGTDHKGNSIHLRITRKYHNIGEVWLYVQLGDGSIYQLAEHPDTIFYSNNRTSWKVGGLKLQMCEPMRKWRISFNGLLKCCMRRKNLEDFERIKIQHVRFSFIWTACSDVIDIERDWSISMVCDALARERWRNGKWMNMRKQLGEGYDQWGVLQGIWMEQGKENCTREFYLRGIRRRRYGKEEALWQRRALTYFGVATDGTMFSIEAKNSERPGLTHAVFGHVYQPDGIQALIDSCDLLLPNLGEHPDCIQQHTVIRFSAGEKHYTASIHNIPHNVTLYGGRPWNYEAHIYMFHCFLNSKHAAGTAVFWYRYLGASPEFPPLSLPILKEPQIKSEASIPLVINFKHRLCGSSALVGGKGSSLGLMTSLRNHKLNAVIPSGFCLTVAALETQLQEIDKLRDAVLSLDIVSTTSSDMFNIQEQCAKTVTLFETTPVCEVVRVAVMDHLRDVISAKSETQLLAVRSSAVGEDSEDMSAAGQNATLLGVCSDLPHVLEAIQSCWASLYTFQSFQYRRQHGQPLQVGMGVVVQEMIAADSAGVLFTCHPSTGDPRQMLITANFGLGESVVSAQVEPDSLVLSRESSGEITVQEIRCGTKMHSIKLSENGGIAAEQLEEEKSSQLSLTKNEAITLGNLGLQLEKMFGSPRDIEWAISKGKIYLLQARPITSLDSWTDYELLHEFDCPIISDTEILTTANVGEVFPGLITPLTQSVTLRSADIATRHGLPHRPGHQYSANVVTFSHHGMINVLNTLLRQVGPEITIGEKVIDLAVHGHLVTSKEMMELAIERNGCMSAIGRLFIVLNLVKDLLRKKRLTQKAEKLAREFSLEFQYYRNAKSLHSTISACLKSLAEVAKCHGNISKLCLFTQVVAISVLTEGSEDLNADHYSDVALMLSSCSDVVSAEIPTDLEELASLINETGRAGEFCQVLPSQAVDWLKNNVPQVASKLNCFLNKHGHRCIKEFELMSETWSMQPQSLMKTLQTMLNNYSKKTRRTSKKIISDKELLSQLKSVKKNGTRVALGWLLSLCRSMVTAREANKNCYITITHKLRMAYRHLSQLMVKEGLIPDRDLLFFFTHYELGTLIHARDPTLINKAMRRRRLQPQWEQITFPDISHGLPVPDTQESVKILDKVKTSKWHLKGTSVCSGTVMGRACVVISLDEIGMLQSGDILITHSTDVGWSPYFPLLGGIVTELGGLISHGAVVAREYGLPCIVGCKNATRIFKTGDMVLLVGATGTLDKIDESENLN